MNNTSPAKKMSDGLAIPLKIAAIYALVGGLWILFSDRFLALLVNDPETLARLQTSKEWFYVIATAGLLYFLIQRSVADIQRSEQALREDEERYRLVFENAPFSIWMCDKQGTVTFANQAALDLFGVSDPTQVVGRYNIYRDVTEAERPLLTYFERAWAGEVVRYRQNLDMTTVKYDTARQETLHLHSTLYTAPISGAQQTNIIVVQEDITKQVQAENELRQKVNDLAALYEASQVFLGQSGAETTLKNVCRLATEHFGLKLAWVGLVAEDDDNVHPAAAYGFEEGYLDSIKITWDDSPTGRGPTGTAIRTAQTVTMNQIDTDPNYKPWRSAAIARGYRSSAALPLLYGEKVLGALNVYSAEPEHFTVEQLQVLQSLANLTTLGLQQIRLLEQVQRHAAELEQRVAERTAELEDQYRHQVVSEERQRLARDLHDVVSQTLFSASVIAETLPRLWERNPEGVRQGLKDLQRLTRGALAEMRMLLLELRPKAFEETILDDLLEQLIEGVSGRTKTTATLQIEGRCPLTPEVREALFRIAQEALNNVVKHARANQVRVSLHSQPKQVELVIRDDGRGFDPDRVTAGRLGLDIMRERIGATLSVTSQPDRGTEVVVIWRSREEASPNDQN
ncbi:MAG: GAF domain-containing protein [Chloroflexi bacterium]|nr:GAF domain-containing protein [Chloroflexota bacterium]